jgi:hypothetical protein
LFHIINQFNFNLIIFLKKFKMRPTFLPTVNFFIDILNKFKRLIRPNGFSSLKYQYIIIDKSPLKQRITNITKGYQRK